MPRGVYPRKKGTKRSLETRLKMSLASKGKPKSLEHRKMLSLAKLGKKSACIGQKRPSMTGENNPRWIKDRTKIKHQEDRNNPEYKQWRTHIWLRDNFKCKIANPECKGRIEAHHIKVWKEYPKLRYQISNGITLCHFHHPKRREDEKRLEQYFIGLVTVSKV